MKPMFFVDVEITERESEIWSYENHQCLRQSQNNISSLILRYSRYAKHFSFVVVVPNNLWNLTNNRLKSQRDWKRNITAFDLILYPISKFFGSSTTNCFAKLNGPTQWQTKMTSSIANWMAAILLVVYHELWFKSSYHFSRCNVPISTREFLVRIELRIFGCIATAQRTKQNKQMRSYIFGQSPKT